MQVIKCKNVKYRDFVLKQLGALFGKSYMGLAINADDLLYVKVENGNVSVTNFSVNGCEVAIEDVIAKYAPNNSSPIVFPESKKYRITYRSNKGRQSQIDKTYSISAPIEQSAKSVTCYVFGGNGVKTFLRDNILSMSES